MQFLVLQAAAVVGAPRSLGLLPGVFLLLAGEEALEVAGAFFVLWGLRPLARQLHLRRGRDRVAQAHPLQAFQLVQRPIKRTVETGLVAEQAV